MTFSFLSVLYIIFFPSQYMQVFYKERLNGYYGVGVYILSNFLSSFPFVAVMSIATGTITYYMVKFRTEFSHYVYICLDLIGCIAVVESSMMIIASLVPNFLMGLIIGAGYIVSVLDISLFVIENLLLMLILKCAGCYDDDCWLFPSDP